MELLCEDRVSDRGRDLGMEGWREGGMEGGREGYGGSGDHGGGVCVGMGVITSAVICPGRLKKHNVWSSSSHSCTEEQ